MAAGDLVRISSPGSLTVWCVAKREEADLLPHTLAPLVAHPSVRHAVVVHTGPVRPDCYGDLQRASSKVFEYHQDFGDGLDRPVASGGFDQVAARNFALGIAELHGDRWLLQFDADDYYDPRIVDLLGRLPTTIRGVRCACYHLLDYRSYWQNDHKVVLDGPEPLLNPHIRLWRNDQQRRFSVCAATASAAANKTRHCGVDFSDLLPEQVTDVAEPLHLHLHYLLRKSSVAVSRRRGRLPEKVRLPKSLESFLRKRVGRKTHATSRVESLVTPVSVIPNGQNTLIYFPFRGFAFLGDDRTTTMIGKLRDGSVLSRNDKSSGFWRELTDLGLIGREREQLPGVKALTEFTPTEATLIFTESCNLGCSYCYASSGPTKSNAMPWPVAKAAIDVIVANSEKQDSKSCSIRYIGGGEPTLQWSMIKRATAYARKRAHAAGVQCDIRLITNGTLLTSERVDWIADNLDFVTLSFDVLPELQAARPFAGGNDTHRQLLNTVDLLCRRGVKFHIRTTVTRKSAARLVDMVWYVHLNTGATSIRFEPMAEVGRGTHDDVGKPAEDVFVEQFVAARKLGRVLGIDVTCKMVGNLHRAAARFCEAEFSVGPDGKVSACHRYSRSDHEGFETFQFGEFDGTSFKFDLDRLNRIRGINVHTFRQCDTCFARWNCAGGCLSARMSGNLPLAEGPLCHLTREVLRATINEKVLLAGETDGQETN